jgi:hypothetical protein
MNFQYIRLYTIPIHEKIKHFVYTFTPYNQKLIFGEQLCISSKPFYI